MEKCHICNRRLSLPLRIVIDGEVRTACFCCAAKEIDDKKYVYNRLIDEKKPPAEYIHA